MSEISRRDFLNGFALTIAAGLTPAAQIAAQPLRYPPALTGMRGHHLGSFEVGHALRDGATFAFDQAPIEESYDLVVVGGGISGLAAAWFYRRAVGGDARILILDNHDDFGGHAKRNEFRLDGRLILGYGGSESLQSPQALYSKIAKLVLSELGVDIVRFETAFERDLYPSLNLSRGVFFPREVFGRDALVTGDPTVMVSDDIAPDRRNGKPVREFIAQFPVSAASKAQLIALYEGTTDPLPGKSADEKLELLKQTSYRDYLIKICGCGEEVANCFQGRTHDFFALGCDSVAAADAREAGYPGFDGLGLAESANPDLDEPYIYHFPDGNASLARLLVRALIPAAAPGSSMDDVVLAPFDYSKLDVDASKVRIRLDSTCVNVRNVADGVELAYMRDGKLHRVAGKHAVLACFNMVILPIMPELPIAQRAALAQNVKAPLVYSKVLIRNWQAWAKLGVHEISAPMSFHSRLKLDYPVSLGGYRHARVPSEPMCLHLVHVPGEPNQNLDARTQFRIGRAKLLTMEFADFEARIRDDLDRMLGAGGFSSARDIAAITVNRWSHGYSYAASSLFDGQDYESILETARQPAGRVAIANADAQGEAYAHTAIDQAARAVREVLD
jgi:spermidine dehydrogenase